MLYFAPQTWTSDDTDACERCKIQYGTSFVYPLVSMGSHVSAIPNHQLMRETPFSTRANVAYFGTFGYELDLNLLDEHDIAQVKRQVAFMKDFRHLIQIDGDFYRLLSPFEGDDTSWMVVASDKSEAVVGYYQKLNKVNASWLRLKLEGLDPDALYEVINLPGHPDMKPQTILEAYGDELMNAGLVIDRRDFGQDGGDFASVLYNLKRRQP
jgi:alpha-galactosidase